MQHGGSSALLPWEQVLWKPYQVNTTDLNIFAEQRSLNALPMPTNIVRTYYQLHPTYGLHFYGTSHFYRYYNTAILLDANLMTV